MFFSQCIFTNVVSELCRAQKKRRMELLDGQVDKIEDDKRQFCVIKHASGSAGNRSSFIFEIYLSGTDIDKYTISTV